MPADLAQRSSKLTARRAVAIALCLISAAPALALDMKPLAGSYAIGSATLVDPPPDESKDRVLLYLERAAARDIYEAMPGPSRVSACDPDLRTKSAGALECTRSQAGEYNCSVGVSVFTGRAVRASVC